MSKDWDYAKLTKEAKEYGGPELYADHLIESGREAGFDEGHLQGGMEGVGITLIAVGVYKFIKYKLKKHKEKRIKLEQEQMELKDKFVQSMKEMDDSQRQEESEDIINSDNLE